jgi:hypothetical protein
MRCLTRSTASAEGAVCEADADRCGVGSAQNKSIWKFKIVFFFITRCAL